MADEAEPDAFASGAAAAAAPPPPVVEIQEMFEGGKLCCIDQELEEIPARFATAYGSRTVHLDLSFNNLRSLRHIEGFSVLEEAHLDNNQLGDDMDIPPLPLLHTLTLNKNRIENLESLLVQLKANCPKLSYLSLLFNAACSNELVGKDDEDYRHYRYLVLFAIPTLKFLDFKAVTPEEVSEAKVHAPFVKVVRVSDSEVERQLSHNVSPTETLPYTPLPQDTRSAESHKATIGYSKYVYMGKHSEGNRFIRNEDL